MIQELQLLFWPLTILTIIVFSTYFYFFWDLIPVEKNDKEIKSRREALESFYDKAITYEEKKEYKKALDYYLAYLHGFNEVYEHENSFPDTVVKVIRNLTKLCQASGEYEMALQFLQAEKFLYENALVRQSQENQNLESTDIKSKSNTKTTKQKTKQEMILDRAEALDKLSELMLKEKKLEMAVSYASKALQLRQQASIETKQEDMDQFIRAYAELGRETYKKNLEWYEQVRKETEHLDALLSGSREE